MRPSPSRAPRAALPLLLLFLAGTTGCDAGAPAPPAAGDAADAADAPGAPEAVWRTLLVERSGDRSARPRRFVPSRDTLRLIVEVGEPSVSVSPAVVIANLLSDATALPVASVRGERASAAAPAADTVLVPVERAPHYLFVAEARGTERWRVVVEEAGG